MTTATVTVPAVLTNATLPRLRKIIANAVENYALPTSWYAPKTNSKAALIEHVDELCNEHDLRVDDDSGELFRPFSTLSLSDLNKDEMAVVVALIAARKAEGQAKAAHRTVADRSLAQLRASRAWAAVHAFVDRAEANAR